MPIFALLIAAALLLFPCAISPEPQDPRPAAPPARTEAPVSKLKVPSLDGMGLKKVAPFDRERFLKSFERQTSQAMINCLRASVGEKGGIEFIARLHSNGQLTAVRSTNATPAQISCAVPMILQMQFPEDLSPELKSKSGEGIEIEWRLDW